MLIRYKLCRKRSGKRKKNKKIFIRTLKDIRAGECVYDPVIHTDSTLYPHIVDKTLLLESIHEYPDPLAYLHSLRPLVGHQWAEDSLAAFEDDSTHMKISKENPNLRMGIHKEPEWYKIIEEDYEMLTHDTCIKHDEFVYVDEQHLCGNKGEDTRNHYDDDDDDDLRTLEDEEDTFRDYITLEPLTKKRSGETHSKKRVRNIKEQRNIDDIIKHMSRLDIAKIMEQDELNSKTNENPMGMYALRDIPANTVLVLDPGSCPKLNDWFLDLIDTYT